MMLHSIRERAKGWFAWVIVILISVPFALWGIGSYITPDQNPEIALVDNVRISSYEFQNALQREQQQLESQSQIINDKLLKQSVLDKLINSQAIINHLLSEGYSVSRATINSHILNDTNFQDPNTGKFSEQVFKQLLQRMGLAFETYKKQLGDDLLIQQYTNAISKSGWVNKSEVDTIVSLLKQKRDISYIIIDSEAFKDSIKVTNEEIDSYYQANKVRFEIAEQVKVAFIEVSRKKIAEIIDVSDEDLNTAYQENLSKYTDPERRQASHILISFNQGASDEDKNKARAEIDSLYGKIKSGEDFATLAKDNSKDPGSARNGGDLGFFGKGDMVPEFETVTYGLKIDGVSEPFESPFGFHIIKLTAIEKEKVKPFDDVKTKILKSIQYDKAEKSYYEITELLQTIAYEQPNSLEPAASETGLSVEESALFTKSGGEGIFANKKLLSTIFNEQVLESGNNSDLVEVANDHTVVVRIVERVPASIKPLEDVKEDIIAILTDKGAIDKAFALAESFAKSLIEKQDIKQQLSDNKLEIIDKGLVERDNFTIDRMILQKAFSLPRVKDKSESTAFMMSAKKAVALIVKKVESGSSDDEEFVKMISANLNRARGSLYANMAIMQARISSKVEINQERLYSSEE